MKKLPNKAQWLNDTALQARVRSPSMRKLDDAIGAYEANPTPSNRVAVRNAFQNWKQHTGADWINSDRNRAPKFPITALDQALKADRQFTEADEIGIKEMIKSRERRIQEVFGNASLISAIWLAKAAFAAASTPPLPAAIVAVPAFMASRFT